MSTGENEQDLRKILDLTRLLSIVLLIIHFYYYCYGMFASLAFRSGITDQLMANISRTGLFKSIWFSKSIPLGLLIISLLGARGKKEDKQSIALVVWLLGIGLILYFASVLIFRCHLSPEATTFSYLAFSISGYCLILSGGTRATRIIVTNLRHDVFNESNETFPQEERLIANEYSVNFKAQYRLQNKSRDSYINIINPFRGVLVVGSPGAGKSWFIILPLIRQQIEKGYGMFIYDFKYDDLSKCAYNWLLKNKKAYKAPPSFYAVNFDDLSTSHRCNPLDPESMKDITDATEAARTILLGLNKIWISKQGDFFVESTMILLSGIIWYLRKYEGGIYCTLPHVIELMQVEYDTLFPILNSEPEVEIYINPFIIAYKNDTTEQLDGQVASTKIAIARLSSPQLYWVLTGNDFTLDINNPHHPKIVCVGNNPAKRSTYGAALSLFASRVMRLINQKGKQKCSMVVDELPTIYLNDLDSQVATARGNLVATILALQDFSQLRKDYGKDLSDVIANICGNIICGQVSGDTAKQISERFGKIIQQRESMSINRNDTSLSKSWQLDSAVPASKIATLSSGEFVGVVADDPHEKIDLKMFHANIVHDSDKANAEMKSFVPIPKIYELTEQDVLDNYHQIKLDVKNLVDKEVDRLVKEKAMREANTHGLN